LNSARDRFHASTASNPAISMLTPIAASPVRDPEVQTAAIPIASEPTMPITRHGGGNRLASTTPLTAHNAAIAASRFGSPCVPPARSM
jgi:hypothetical protein